jgi:plastocyanin
MMTSPPPLNATVFITDKGFYPKQVNIGQSSGALVGIVTFINKGNNTHTATELTSSYGYRVSAAGGVMVGLSDWNGSNPNAINFETGGIGPGQQQTVGFQGTDADYSYNSQTDCQNGNTNAAFDCTPSIVHAIDYQGDQSLAKSVAGTMVAPQGTDFTQCAEYRNQPTVDGNGNPTGTQNVCILPYRIRAKTKGNDQKPLSGNIPVTLDDFSGFLPGKMTVLTGTTVTWTNTGNQQHGIYYKPAVWANMSSNGGNIVDSGALNPGQSFSYTFPIPLTSSASIGMALRQDNVDATKTPIEQGSKAWTSSRGGAKFNLPPLYFMTIKVDCPPTQFTPFGAAGAVGRGLPCQQTLPVLSIPSYQGATKA